MKESFQTTMRGNVPALYAKAIDNFGIFGEKSTVDYQFFNQKKLT